MAKFHYLITSRKKAKIEKNVRGKTRVIVEDVVKLEENGMTEIDYGNFISSNEKKRKKHIWSDYITSVLLSMALIAEIALLATLGIGKDFNILTSNYIDVLIGLAALSLGIVSIPWVKEFLGKKLVGPRVHKKLCYSIIIIALSLVVIYLMQQCNISSSISNILGILGIVISIFCW